MYCNLHPRVWDGAKERKGESEEESKGVGGKRKRERLIERDRD